MKKEFIIISLLFTAIIVNAQTYQQLAKLIAADRATGNQFGNAVAISGNYAVVAAADISYGQIQNSCQCAYVFEKTNGNWIQKQKLVPSDNASGIDFGHTVSISGNSIIVGAPGDDNNAGAAYIFERNSAGNWLQVKKIVPPNKSAGDLFGTSVSIIANYAVVGAPGDDGLASGWPQLPGAGSACFFTNLNGSWEFLNKAFPVAGAYYDRSQGAAFGFSVSISGITGKGISAVIGAPFEKKDTTGANPMDGAGAAYVFERNLNGGMELVHKIVYWRRAPGDQFGYSVSMSGNQMVIGAPFTKEDARQENPIISGGAVHVFFKQVDGNWWWDRVLVPNDRAIGDNFGSSVCISGDLIIAGAPAKKVIIGNVNYAQAGAAYLFKFSNDSLSAGWRPVNRIIANDHTDMDWFGYAVGIDGKNVIVGTPFQDKDVIGTALAEAGAIYIFGQTTCASTDSSISPSACRSYTSPSKKYTWSATGTYTDIIPNKAGCDSIITINLTITHKVDTSVTQKGNTLTANIKDASYQWIDCATNQPINVNTRSLIATVNGSYKVRIEHDGCSGISSCYTVKPNPPMVKQPLDQPVNTTPQSNSQLKEFVEINKLVPKDRQGYENFGYSVGISGEYAVIGANVDDKDANGDNPISDAGSAYIFKKQRDGKWKQVQKIVASDRANGDNFGWSVAINLNHIVVGAIYHDKDIQGHNHGPSSGAAYVFELGDDGVWIQKQKLIANPIESQILFGNSVAIDGNTIAVGCSWYAKDATGTPESNLNGAGAVFVFDKTGGSWVQSQILTPKIRTIDNLGDDLGYSVSICGDLLIAGAWQSDFDAKGLNKMETSGAAYIFERNGGKWKEVQKIVPSDRAAHDEFGVSVAISGDNAIIGARAKTETTDPDSRAYTGNAYIFSRKAAPGRVRPDGGVILTPDDGTWKQVLKISPEDRRPDDYLGWSVSMSGDFAIVSAMKQDTDSLDNLINDGGAIYVFYQDRNGRWSQTGKLATFDRSQLDNFGYAVAISGCDIIGGTIVDQEDDKDANALTSAGSAYIFSAADCRNVAPCYKPKVTPGIKTPLDKTDQSKNIEAVPKPATTDKPKNNKPEKIQSGDLNAKGNDVVIDNVELKEKEIDSLKKAKPGTKKN